jgi:hypothetical protein
VIRVYDEAGNVIEFPLILTLRESPIRVPQKQSTFHPRAQRNASRRRDTHQRRRSFARWNSLLGRSPTPRTFGELISDDFPVLHAITSIFMTR